MIPASPVVSSSTSVICDKHILVIVQVPVLTILNTVDDAGLQINKERPWNVVLIISLVEEHILAIASLITRPEVNKKTLSHNLMCKTSKMRRVDSNLSCKILKNAVLADAVLQAELLPKLHAYLIPALSHL